MSDDKKTRRIIVMCSEDEAAELETAAEIDHRPTSSFVRAAALDRARVLIRRRQAPPVADLPAAA